MIHPPTTATRRPIRQQRLQPRPLLIRQIMSIKHDPGSTEHTPTRSTGHALVAAGLQGAVLTLIGKDTFTINLTPHAPPVTLSTFAAEWIGHTRQLTITTDGHASEHIDSGCCDPVIDLTFRLSQPRGTPADATATATVTSVTLHNWPPGEKAPTVGQAGTLKLQHGVITEPLSGTTYCNLAEQTRGTCGA